MSFGLLKPNFRVPQNNFTATPNTGNFGVRFTASATPHTKGAYTQVVASLNYDVEYMYIQIEGTNSNGAVRNGLADIAIGAAASEQVIVTNINVSGTGSQGASMTQGLLIPIRIPAGTRVAGRFQSITISNTIDFQITFFGGSSIPVFPSYSGVDTVGDDTSTSNGLPHTAGNTGVESTWTSIGSPITRDWRAVQLCVGIPNGAALNGVAYHFEVGYSSTTLMEWFCVANGNEQLSYFPFGPVPCVIPSGSQVQIRGECSASGQQLTFTVMGYY